MYEEGRFGRTLIALGLAGLFAVPSCYALRDATEPVQGVGLANPPAGVARIGGGVSAPIVLYAPEPKFSQEARQDKVGGSVLVYLQVDETGSPTHVRIIRGVGHGLDEKAVEAVKQYKFKPAMRDGQPVTVEMNVMVNFQIDPRKP